MRAWLALGMVLLPALAWAQAEPCLAVWTQPDAAALPDRWTLAPQQVHRSAEGDALLLWEGRRFQFARQVRRSRSTACRVERAGELSRIPAEGRLLPAGGAVFFDTHGRRGHGVVLERVDARGRTVWSRTLLELVGPQRWPDFEADGAARRWSEGWWLDAEADAVVVRLAAPVGGAVQVELEHGRARWLRGGAAPPRGSADGGLPAERTPSRAELRRLASDEAAPDTERLLAQVELLVAGDRRADGPAQAAWAALQARLAEDPEGALLRARFAGQTDDLVLTLTAGLLSQGAAGLSTALAYSSSPEPTLRRAALHALELLGEVGADRELATLLAEDPAPEVRAAAARGLARSGSRRWHKALLTAAGRDGAAAALALAQLPGGAPKALKWVGDSPQRGRALFDEALARPPLGPDVLRGLLAAGVLDAQRRGLAYALLPVDPGTRVAGLAEDPGDVGLLRAFPTDDAAAAEALVDALARWTHEDIAATDGVQRGDWAWTLAQTPLANRVFAGALAKGDPNAAVHAEVLALRGDMNPRSPAARSVAGALKRLHPGSPGLAALLEVAARHGIPGLGDAAIACLEAGCADAGNADVLTLLRSATKTHPEAWLSALTSAKPGDARRALAVEVVARLPEQAWLRGLRGLLDAGDPATVVQALPQPVPRDAAELAARSLLALSEAGQAAVDSVEPAALIGAVQALGRARGDLYEGALLATMRLRSGWGGSAEASVAAASDLLRRGRAQWVCDALEAGTSADRELLLLLGGQPTLPGSCARGLFAALARPVGARGEAPAGGPNEAPPRARAGDPGDATGPPVEDVLLLLPAEVRGPLLLASLHAGRGPVALAARHFEDHPDPRANRALAALVAGSAPEAGPAYMGRRVEALEALARLRDPAVYSLLEELYREAQGGYHESWDRLVQLRQALLSRRAPGRSRGR